MSGNSPETSRDRIHALGDQFLPRTARGLLLVLLAVLYSGATPFLVPFSPYLYLCYQGLVVGCLLLCLFLDRGAVAQWRSIVPYLIWVVIYLVWGFVVSPDQDQILGDVVRTLVYSFLFLSAVAIAITNKGYLVRFAHLIQLVAIINFGLSLYETTQPSLVETLAYSLNPDTRSFSVMRPAGLWVNANEAALAFLFCLLLSYWSRGAIAWMGRLAAIGGIYLSASRSGMYILVVCGLLYLVPKLRTVRFSRPRVVLALAACMVLVLMAVSASFYSKASFFDFSDSYAVNRALDFDEQTDQTIGQDTRRGLAEAAVQTAYEAPWYGMGAFAFQGLVSLTGSSRNQQGAHNIYLAVWGETGVVVAVGYLVVLAIGVRRLLRSRSPLRERSVLALMWLGYLLVGFASHTQIRSLLCAVLVALLYHLPTMMEGTRERDGETARPRTGEPANGRPVLAVSP